MAFKKIDHVNGRDIRRLYNEKRENAVLGYISGKPDADGDLTEVEQHKTLTEARNFCGAPPADTPKTAPKSSYMQCQKGYKADNTKKQKA